MGALVGSLGGALKGLRGFQGCFRGRRGFPGSLIGISGGSLLSLD